MLMDLPRLRNIATLALMTFAWLSGQSSQAAPVHTVERLSLFIHDGASTWEDRRLSNTFSSLPPGLTAQFTATPQSNGDTTWVWVLRNTGGATLTNLRMTNVQITVGGSMNYYQWSMSMKYAEFSYISDRDCRKVCWDIAELGDPLPPLERWGEVPLLTQYLGDDVKPRKPKKVGDTDGRYINERAKEALGDIWGKSSLLYPVCIEEFPGESWYMVVPTVRLPCLDEEKSVFYRRSNGQPYMVGEWIFKDSVIGDADLFWLDYSWTNPRTMFVSECFKQRVIEAKLKGFCFKTSFLDPKPFVS